LDGLFGNIGTELMIDYSANFTTYEIFQSREALIMRAEEVGKIQGFIILLSRNLTGTLLFSRDSLWNCHLSQKLSNM